MTHSNFGGSSGADGRSVPSEQAGGVVVSGGLAAAALLGAATMRRLDPLPKDYVPSAESLHELHQIDLDVFEGPLDLLLFLIKRHEIDIFDIPISFICGRYLEYMRMMEDLNIDVAAEFLFMASELVHIKSRLLLPKPKELAEPEEADPRADLVQRLLEYQKYKEAAARLDELHRLQRDVFARPAQKPLPAPEVVLKEVSVFALVEAFHAVLKRQKPEVRHHVVLEQVSVRRRMHLLVDELARRGELFFLEAIATTRGRLDIVVVFLAVLELTRLRLIKIVQTLQGVLLLQPCFATSEEAMELIAGVEDTRLAG